MITAERDKPILPPSHPSLLSPVTMEALSEKAKIYVGKLPVGATDDVLSAYFAKYGRVLHATIPKGGSPRNPKDFGFVWFADEDSAKAAVWDVEEHVILGTKVEVKESDRRRQPSVQQGRTGCHNCNGRNPKKIFIGGLPSDLTQDEFKSLFERYGETTDAVIIVESPSRRPRGFGFVTFASEESAREVLQHNQYLIRGKAVEVKAAIPKEEPGSSGNHGGHSPGRYHPPPATDGHSYHASPWYEYPTYFPVTPFVPHHGCQPWPTLGLPHAGASPYYSPSKHNFGATRGFKPIKISEPPEGRGSSSASGAKGPSPAPAEGTGDVQLSTPGENNDGTGPSPVSEDCRDNTRPSPPGESNGTSASPPNEE
ncbi:hypothetical protein MLD38_022373 [Melastoma candidum]|uniref:Uncharacterized protein n=1 Tax=Melastoma candidum TaxID=119954 RepID=A0ACB9QM19_9MYRT|nr:hypothetical protein MLD38_022373 [Melastoma candidum]